MAAPSKLQVAGLPSTVSVSSTHTCGLAHCTSFTTPFQLALLLASNMANEWWAWASAATASRAAAVTRTISLVMGSGLRLLRITVVLAQVFLEAAARRHRRV